MPVGVLGLIVVGDYALATGADRHVAFVASVLGRSHLALSWVAFVPADRVQLASALYEAWQRPHPVACFGGLGNGIDDVVRVTVNALQAGREQVGLIRHTEIAVEGRLQCANVSFFSGHPERAHFKFERWWRSHIAVDDADALGGAEARFTERIRWTLPETGVAADARRKAKSAYPTVIQRLTQASAGEIMLTFSGASKGKAQGARKTLQRALGTSVT